MSILQFKYLISTYCSGKLRRGSGLWQRPLSSPEKCRKQRFLVNQGHFFRMISSYLQFQVGHFLNRCTIPPYCRSKAQETTITKALKQFICTHETKSLDKPSLLSCPSFSCPSLYIFPVFYLLFFTDILKSSKSYKQIMPIRKQQN